MLLYCVTGEDVTAEPQFLTGFVRNFLKIQNTEVLVFDSNSVMTEMSDANVTYATDTCYEAIDKLNEAYNSNDPEKTTICFFININSMLGKLSSIEKTKLTTLIADCKNKNNIKCIIVDGIDAIKSINFEPWFKPNVDLAEGIWLGNGLSNQFTLKVTTNARILRAEVSPGFGYIIKKGKAALMKLMSDE